MAFDTKQAYLDSPPTKQSRLVTCGCPHRKESDSDDAHNITVVWKGQGEGGDPQVLIANASYIGKPLPLKPGMIKNYTADHFPLGMFYIVCSCQLKPGQKPPYRGYEVIDLNAFKTTQISASSPTSGSGTISASESGHEENIAKMMRKNQSALIQILNQIQQDLAEFMEDEQTAAKTPGATTVASQAFSREQENSIRRIVQEVVAKSETRLADLLHSSISRVTRADLQDRTSKPRSSLSIAAEEATAESPEIAKPQATTEPEVATEAPSSMEESPSAETQAPVEAQTSVGSPAPVEPPASAEPPPVATQASAEANASQKPETHVAIRMRRKPSPQPIHDDEDEIPLPESSANQGETINVAFAQNNAASVETESEELQRKYNPSLGVTKVIEAAVYKKMFEDNIGDIGSVGMIEETKPTKIHSIGLRKSDVMAGETTPKTTATESETTPKTTSVPSKDSKRLSAARPQQAKSDAAKEKPATDQPPASSSTPLIDD